MEVPPTVDIKQLLIALRMFNKDMQRKILLDTPVSHIHLMCKLNDSFFNANFCNNNYFWKDKLVYSYPKSRFIGSTYNPKAAVYREYANQQIRSLNEKYEKNELNTDEYEKKFREMSTYIHIADRISPLPCDHKLIVIDMDEDQLDILDTLFNNDTRTLWDIGKFEALVSENLVKPIELEYCNLIEIVRGGSDDSEPYALIYVDNEMVDLYLRISFTRNPVLDTAVPVRWEQAPYKDMTLEQFEKLYDLPFRLVSTEEHPIVEKEYKRGPIFYPSNVDESDEEEYVVEPEDEDE